MTNIPIRISPTRRTPERYREQGRMKLTRSRKTPDLGRNTIGPLRSRLAQVKSAWTSYRCTRDRGAVFSYLQAVFDLVTMWSREALPIAFSRALEIATGKSRIPAEPFAAVIVCTSGVAKVDGRTLSKWSRALQYVAGCKKEGDSLKAFMAQAGGVNACASRLQRRPKGSGTVGISATGRNTSGRLRR
jgi:hypothetical protein